MTSTSRDSASVALLCILVLFHIQNLSGSAFYSVAISILICALAYLRRDRALGFLSLFLLIRQLIPLVVFPDLIRDVPAFVHLISFGLAIVPFALKGIQAKVLSWWKIGEWTPQDVILSILVTVSGSFVLVFWGLGADQLGSAEEIARAMIPRFPSWAIWVLGVPAYCFAAALAEEIVFRGALFSVFRREFSAYSTIIFQSLAFGATYLTFGFPIGWSGYLLMGILGFFLGVLRERTQGVVFSIAINFVVKLIVTYYIFFFLYDLVS